MYEELIERYRHILAISTIESGRLWERGEAVMPLGAPSSLQYHDPWPVVLEKGKGCHVWDLDGNEYTDFHLGFSVDVMGHNNPKIQKALGGMVHTGFLVKEAVLFCEVLCKRYNKEQVQLVNSGLEATMLAVRIARTATKRRGVIKIEGGYHGLHDSVMVSTHPALKDAGTPDKPEAVIWGEGVYPEGTDVVPYNDLDALEKVLATKEHACLIIEPLLFNVGFIRPKEGYLARVVELCHEHDVLVIFDEVKTGLTLSYGGAEDIYQVSPDLKCLGKGIGGGLPCGAVLADKYLMDLIPEKTPHYSTFAGNPLTMRAGLVSLEKVMTPQAHKRMDKLNKLLVSLVNEKLDAYGIEGYAIGVGNKGTVIFSSKELENYRDWAEKVDFRLGRLYWLVMMNEGILMSPGGDEQWTISVAHTEDDIHEFVRAFEVFCTLVKDTHEWSLWDDEGYFDE